jgi:hypothetical protein
MFHFSTVLASPPNFILLMSNLLLSLSLCLQNVLY